jgi:hypothetical protein
VIFGCFVALVPAVVHVGRDIENKVGARSVRDINLAVGEGVANGLGANLSVGMEREPKLTTIYNVAGYQT